MGLGELVTRLERDADARIAQLRAQAKADVEAIDAEAGRVSAAKQHQSLASRGAERRKALERELASVRTAARAARLEAQHAVLAKVKAKAVELLLARAGEPAARKVVADAFREALRYVEGLEVVVRCAPAAVEVLKPLATPRVRFEAVADAAPGFALATADGALRIDGALAARLEAQWPRLAMELLRSLAPQRRGEGQREGPAEAQPALGRAEEGASTSSARTDSGEAVQPERSRGPLLHQPPLRGEGGGP